MSLTSRLSLPFFELAFVFESIVLELIFEATAALAQGNRYRHCCIRPMRDRKCRLYRLMERFQHERARASQVPQNSPAAVCPNKNPGVAAGVSAVS
jgi:hypothetical protein